MFITISVKVCLPHYSELVKFCTCLLPSVLSSRSLSFTLSNWYFVYMPYILFSSCVSTFFKLSYQLSLYLHSSVNVVGKQKMHVETSRSKYSLQCKEACYMNMDPLSYGFCVMASWKCPKYPARASILDVAHLNSNYLTCWKISVVIPIISCSLSIHCC